MEPGLAGSSSGGGTYRPDRPRLPALVSLDRFPARGRIAGFPAPCDASRPAVGRRWIS
jgi:hypothetical protein